MTQVHHEHSKSRPLAAAHWPTQSPPKPGSKNRTTLVAAALLEGEAEELVRKAIELAKAGDVAMLKFLLERILPRERLISSISRV